MQFGQTVRRWSAHLQALMADLRVRGRLGALKQAGPLPRLMGLVLLGLVAYYGIGALLMNAIDDNPAFGLDETVAVAGQSRTVALADALLDRELNGHGWVANDPFFLPTVLLDNMANYQIGLVAGLASQTNALAGALKARGAPDSELEAAAERLAKPGTVWVWDWSRALGFLGRSENQYREGLLALQGYNKALEKGESRLPTDGAFLALLVAKMADDLAGEAAALETAAAAAPALFAGRVDDAFYRAKGFAYASLILSNGLAQDFAAPLGAAKVSESWQAARQALTRAATFSPLIIMNGAPGGVLLPSHPLAQGYFLLDSARHLQAVAATLR